MTTTDAATQTEIAGLVDQSRALRSQLALTAAEVDRAGVDATENMRLIAECGLNRLNVPAAYGGLASGEFKFAWDAVTEIVTNISAGEGGTGLNWLVHGAFTRLALAPDNGMPESTHRELARAVLEDGARIVGSNAEVGVPGPGVAARPVDGGLVVQGTKSFNTNSGGPRHRTYATVGLRVDYPDGPRGTVAVIRLDSPGVIYHDDWDNMGQRATASGRITYDDVFVPDGWYYEQELSRLLIGAGNGLLIGAVVLGIGLGAFEAALEYLREADRVITPGSAGPADDPIMRARLGTFSARLAAALELQRSVARDVERFEPGDDDGVLEIACHRSKVASFDAALEVTGSIHELTGARSTSNRYALDRFWRNARTFSVHDPRDLRSMWVGGYELDGQLPPGGESVTSINLRKSQ